MIGLILGLIVFHFILYEEYKYEDFEDSLTFALYERFKEIIRGDF